MIWLATPLLAVFAWLVGRALLERVAPAAARSLPASFAGGLIVWHVLLQALVLAGWRWSALWLAALAGSALAATAQAFFGRRKAAAAIPVRAPARWGWGDAIAAGCVAAVAWAVAVPWIDNPDFVLHWGVKGRKLAVAAGIDWRYLTSPSAWHVHPDYPNLLPELTSWTIRLARSTAAGPQLLWSAVFFAAGVLAAREALVALGASRRVIQAAIAAIAAAIAAFAFGAELGGSADWLIVFALLLALPALALPAAPGSAARLAIAAALAAASKIEGVPLAFLLLAAFAWARWRAGSGLRSAVSVAARASVPAFAVALPWAVLCTRYGLFQTTNHGAWSWQRFAVAAPELLRGLLDPTWSGLALSLLLLPGLLRERALRVPTLVLLAQAALYVAIYATAPVDTVFYVRTSWARLLFHLLPAVWVLAASTVEREAGSAVSS